MRTLTALEAKFLSQLKTRVGQNDSDITELFLSNIRTKEPSLQIGIRFAEETNIIYFEVLVYGNRPVRYHLSTPVDDSNLQSRYFWNSLFGPLNLVSEKSGIRGQKLHLFYQVDYPEKELKRLGEKL